MASDQSASQAITTSESAAPSMPPPPRRESSAWRLPPRYQALGAIARGGMGLVLRVRDVEVDRPLALKLLLNVKVLAEQAQSSAKTKEP